MLEAEYRAKGLGCRNDRNRASKRDEVSPQKSRFVSGLAGA